MIALTLRHYLSRFAWEIASFWAISIGNTILLARNGPPAVMRATAVLEIVALAWTTVRLVLAEDGFKTSGGWQTRPFSHKIRLGLPLALAVVIVVFPAILRAFAFQRMFDGAALWSDFGPGSWWRQVGTWFLFFALPLKLFGVLILQRIEGRARTATWATLALILLPLVAAMGEDFGKRRQSYGGSGGNGPNLLAQGIQRELPDATDFIGTWNDPVPGHLTEVPAAKLIAKFSIDPDLAPSGASLSSFVASLRGSRVNVRVRALLNQKSLRVPMDNAIAILRYADGTYATNLSLEVARPGSPLPFFPATEWEFSGDFVSPLSLPEFEGDPQRLTRGLELMFFVRDRNRPQMATDPSRLKTDIPFHFRPTTMAELFAQFPWSDEIWKKTARGFLMKHATRGDIPFLLDRMRVDPRISSIFILNRWELDALPVLWELAERRVPLSAEVILLLAEQKVPARSADLAAVALQLKSGLSDVENSLRAQPGFDWPAFANELWRRKKYTTNWLEPRGEFWQAAFWAAQEGDFTALRQTAEQAAAGKIWETDHLRKLVPDGPDDIVAYLRDNLGQLKYDPQTRVWRR